MVALFIDMFYSNTYNLIVILLEIRGYIMADSKIPGVENKKYLITQNELCGKTERILNSFQLSHVGICNRLKQLFTNMRLHKGEYDTVNIHWPIKGKVETPFKKLFDLKAFERINEINYSIFLDAKYYEEGSWRLFLTSQEFRELRVLGLQYIDFEFNNIPQKFIDLYKPYFMALKPSKEVQALIDSVQLPENCVAVHIRHKDDWKRWNRWGENDIDKFIEEMHKYDSDTYFYAACLCQEVHDAIYSEFKDRIIALPNDYSKKNNILDVAELFLLSKPKKLIGTYGSTFTECVWWLSGCTQDVTIIGSDDSWKNGGLPDSLKPKQ